MQKLVEEFYISHPGYLKKSPFKTADRLKLNYINEPDLIKEIIQVQKLIKNKLKAEKTVRDRLINNGIKTPFIDLSAFPGRTIEEILEFAKGTVSGTEAILNEEDLKSRVLVIGDIHEPFTIEGYLEFCKEQYRKFNCNKVIFIGDVIDNAFSSFHPTNPDGYGAGDELDRAIDKIALWYKAFPEAIVIIGNHDRLAYRKAFTGGISARWLRTYNDVLNTPNWKFEESIEIDDVLYIHGEAGTARMKAKDISQSVVQGHLHSQAYCEWINNRIFAVQVGAGINDKEYAFNYNKAGKESILSCSVIENGNQPYLIKFNK